MEVEHLFETLYPVYRLANEEIEVQERPCSANEVQSVVRLGYQIIENLEQGTLIYVPGYRAYYVAEEG